MSVHAWLEHRILVCVGTGGVGKTTIAAAIALEAGRRGKRALVVTIDPAQRLADALGTGPLDHREREIPEATLRAAGIETKGSLSAMMLDTKRTFDEIVERYAPDAQTLERILGNPIYENLTDALAGSREYSAMEKLYQIHAEGGYDLVVLDTPPARHALEFLDAPRRLTGFLNSQILKLLFRPAVAMGRTGFRLFQFGSATLLPVIERVTGLEFLRSISEFLLAFEGMLQGFLRRADEVDALLRSPECGFVLVAGPDPAQARRAEEFWKRLQAEQIHLVGLAVNRVRTWPGAGPIPATEAERCSRAREWLGGTLARHGGGSDAERTAQSIVETVARQASLARRDAEVRKQLAATLPLPDTAIRVIPLFGEDVHALDSLARIGQVLFGRGNDG